LQVEQHVIKPSNLTHSLHILLFEFGYAILYLHKKLFANLYD